MKRKHYGLLALVVMALSFGAVGLAAFKSLGKSTGESPFLRLKPLETVSAPGPNAIREMERLDTELPSLAHPSGPDVSEVNLGLFGYEPIRKRKYSAVGGESLLPPGMNYSISLAFSSATKGFCVIDGVFCQEGSTLPDGAQIVRVEPRRVLVKKGSFKHWIPVAKSVRSLDRREKKTGE